MTRENPHPVRFESVVFYLRDPNVGGMQREAFERAAGEAAAVFAVDLSGPGEGGGAYVYRDGVGSEHVCPVGGGMVVFDRGREVGVRRE